MKNSSHLPTGSTRGIWRIYERKESRNAGEMSPAAFRKTLAAMPLGELLKARRMTQARLAETLGVKQGEGIQNRLEPKPRLASTSQRLLENLVHTNIPFQ